MSAPAWPTTLPARQSPVIVVSLQLAPAPQKHHSGAHSSPALQSCAWLPDGSEDRSDANTATAILDPPASPSASCDATLLTSARVQAKSPVPAVESEPSTRNTTSVSPAAQAGVAVNDAGPTSRCLRWPLSALVDGVSPRPSSSTSQSGGTAAASVEHEAGRPSQHTHHTLTAHSQHTHSTITAQSQHQTRSARANDQRSGGGERERESVGRSAVWVGGGQKLVR